MAPTKNFNNFRFFGHHFEMNILKSVSINSKFLLDLGLRFVVSVTRKNLFINVWYIRQIWNFSNSFQKYLLQLFRIFLEIILVSVLRIYLSFNMFPINLRGEAVAYMERVNGSSLTL